MLTRPKLTDTAIKRLPAPASDNAVTWDTAVIGLGVRVTAAGHRSFVLNYRTYAGRQRRYTIGSFPRLVSRRRPRGGAPAQAAD